MSYRLEPYDLAREYLVALPTYPLVADADEDLRAAFIVPMGIARHTGLVDGGPYTIDQIFNPEIEVWNVGAREISDGGVEATIHVCIDRLQLIVVVEPWPGEGVIAEVWVQQLEVIEQGSAY